MVRERQVSITDIAKVAGVSAMTVSRLMTGKATVSNKTRKRILDAIKETGYRKDVFASINASKRRGIKKRKHVALNFPVQYFKEDMFSNFFSYINIVLINEFQRMGVDYSIIHIGDDASPSNLDPIVMCDLVVYCGSKSAGAYEMIQRLNPTARALTICFKLEGVASVLPDDVEGGKLAARYFCERKHESVMCLVNEEDDCFVERFSSFESTCRLLNPDLRVDRLSYTTRQFNSDTNLLEKWLQDYLRNNKPDGVFSVNGHETMVVYKVLRDIGLKVPYDIGLLGYDDLEFYRYLDTPLSHVLFEKEELGRAAAVMVKNIIESEEEILARKMIVPVSLVDRESVISKNEMSGASRCLRIG